MDPAELLALYDRALRREIEYHDARREALPNVVRHTSTTGEGSFVLFSALDERTVDAEIEAQIAYFEAIGSDFEWKVFDYDSPPDLCARLAARGFDVDDPEAVMVLDLASAPAALSEPVDDAVVRIIDPAGVADVAAVEESVWQRDYTELTERLARDLINEADILDIFLAYINNIAASVGWIYYHDGSSFASLFGGSTVERFRGRGLYTALLAARVQAASARGFRFLTVDASPMSRPILERHGFITLTNAYACRWQVGTSGNNRREQSKRREANE